MIEPASAAVTAALRVRLYLFSFHQPLENRTNRSACWVLARFYYILVAFYYILVLFYYILAVFYYILVHFYYILAGFCYILAAFYYILVLFYYILVAFLLYSGTTDTLAPRPRKMRIWTDALVPRLWGSTDD